MDALSVNSFIPTLDQIDSWSEILTLLPILIILEILLSADNAVALASLTKSLKNSEDRTRALNIGITISLILRILLILLSAFLLRYLFVRIFAGLYLIYLFFSNVILKKQNYSDDHEGVDDPNFNKINFIKVVTLLSITDLAFSIDSITTAVAISDQYILVITGAVIGVIALRFTSEIFLRLIDYFTRLEMAGYVAILIIGSKLILNTIFIESFLPDFYFYILIFISFIWGFSEKKSKDLI